MDTVINKKQMDSRSKGGWGLPVIVAVGAFAYYCTTLKLSADPQQRRRAILQRLYDGSSPQTLLDEGYTRAELLDAGVPRAALSSPSTNAAPRGSPSASFSDLSRYGSSEQHPNNSDGGAFHWLHDTLLSVNNTIQAVSCTLANNLRGRSASTSLGDSKASLREASLRHTTSSPVSASEAASNNKCTIHSPSVRLAPSLFLKPSKVEMSIESVSPERTRSRTPGGALQAHVAALSAAVARGYSEESVTYRYPLEVLRFLHEDGSRLSVMAESCAAVENDADSNGMTTDLYVQRSLARARAAADTTKTYFKVKLSTAARNIATTVMESYVNMHVGPSPVILTSFYLVSHGVAYTIQLQTHTGAYEERLSDLIYTAQSARLHESEGDSTMTRTGSKSNEGSNRRGHNVFQLRAPGSDGAYTLQVPVDLVARAEEPANGRRSSLTLTPSGGSQSNAAWYAKVEVRSLNLWPTPPLDGATLLRDDHVTITLTMDHIISASTPMGDTPAPLSSVTARVASTDDAAAPINAYVAPSLVIPLPPPEQFCTTVCEHPHDPFVTLFITTASDEVMDVFEVELRCMTELHTRELEVFFAYLASLFLTPSRPQRKLNGVGQDTFAVEGLAAAPPETSLRVYGVQVSEGNWFVVRWLYADSAIFPRELEQYRRSLVDDVSS
jgi:hypothetical protein